MWLMVLTVGYYHRDNELKANFGKRKALTDFRRIHNRNNVTYVYIIGVSKECKKRKENKR